MEVTSLADLLGPQPPAAVCPGCGVVVCEDWENPVLVTAKSSGRYFGDVRGGLLACEPCQRAFTERQRARETRTPDFAASVPYWGRGITLDSTERTKSNERAIGRVADWSASRDRDLFLFGPTGSGKTHLAIAGAFEALHNGAASALFVRVPALLRQIRDGFGKGQESGAVLARCVSVDVLVLDDIGAEYMTEFAGATIEGLYSERLDAGRRTVLTSNLPLDVPAHDLARPVGERWYGATLGAHLGDDRMPSRIAGFAEVLEIAGQDFRLVGWRKRAKV